MDANVSEVDAFSCGEPGGLRELETARVPKAFRVASSAGQLAVLVELRQTHGEAVAAYLSGEEGWKSVWYVGWVSWKGT